MAKKKNIAMLLSSQTCASPRIAVQVGIWSSQGLGTQVGSASLTAASHTSENDGDDDCDDGDNNYNGDVDDDFENIQ